MKKFLALILSALMLFSVMATVYVSGNETYSYNTVQDFNGFANDEINVGQGTTVSNGMRFVISDYSSNIKTMDALNDINYGCDNSTGLKIWSGSNPTYLQAYAPVTAEMRSGAVGFRIWFKKVSAPIGGLQLRFFAQKDGTDYIYKKTGYTISGDGSYVELFFNDSEIAKHSQTPAGADIPDLSVVPEVSSYNMSEDLTYIGFMITATGSGNIAADNFEIISSDEAVEEDTTVPTEPEEESSSTTTTTTTTTVATEDDYYNIEDVSVADNWQVGNYHWETGEYASNDARACLKKLVKVDPAKSYALDATNADGLNYAIREYNSEKKMISSISKLTFGSKYTPSSSEVAYISITMYDGTPLERIQNGTILPSMAEYVEEETSSTTTTTTTTTVPSTPEYDGETVVKEIITGGEWVKGFWRNGVVDQSTDTASNLYRLSYNAFLKVLPNTTYTITTKMDRGATNANSITFKQYDANKTQLSSVNYSAYDLGNNFTKTVTTSATTEYITITLWNSFDYTFTAGTEHYKSIKTALENGDIAVSIKGAVAVDELEVMASMQAGASIRLGDVNGLRFYTTVDAEKIAKLQEEGATVEAGTLIAPYDVLDGDALTFDLESAKYIDVTFDLSKGYYDNKNTIVGSIVKIKESDTAYSKESGNITRKFIGRGYVKVTKDGRTFITYADYAEYNPTNNTRSLKQVATSFRDANEQSELYELFKEAVDRWADAILAVIDISQDMVGGNITVTNVEENTDGSYTVTLKNQLRDSTEDWFYWAFKVEGAGGKTVKFQFSQGNRVGYYGAAVSHDLETWDWTNNVSGESFTYTFGEDETTVYFAHSMLYHPERFYDLADELGLQVQTLCTSEGGNAVPCVKFGNGDKGIVLTARHHACESTGNYVLEGVLKELATSDYIKENYTVMYVPFVDIDGVLAGDQGKNRAPHDHNRDYIGEFGETDNSIYAAVRAIREYVEDPANNVVQAYDSHSPWHKTDSNDSVFVYKKFAPGDARLDNLNSLLTSFKNNIDDNCFPYTGNYDYEYGDAGNSGTDGTEGRAFSTYMTKIPTLVCGTTFETAFFKSNGVQFTGEKAVNTGKALGKAIIELSETLGE